MLLSSSVCEFAGAWSTVVGGLANTCLPEQTLMTMKANHGMFALLLRLLADVLRGTTQVSCRYRQDAR